MARNARQYIFKPYERIDSDSLAGGYQTPQHRGGLAALVAAEERPVRPSDRDAADGSFGSVVVDFETAVLAVTRQRRPVLQRVAHRAPLRTLGQQLRFDLQQELMQLVQNGPRLALAQLQSRLVRPAPRALFNPVQMRN